MFSPDLNEKLDTLSLREDEGYMKQDDGKRDVDAVNLSPTSRAPKKSLLSTSLAGERANYAHMKSHLQMLQGAASAKQPFFTLEDTHVHVLANQLVKEDLKDEHPEPELLASSVGKEIGGRLVPSSLTISLLSLNDHEENTDSAAKQPFALTSPKMPNHFSDNVFVAQQMHPQLFQQQTTSGSIADRKNSSGNIRLVASRSSITQQRMQPYHKFTSPPPTQLTSSTNLSSSHSHQDYLGQTRPISINRMAVPDSPSLDPTSLGGSPSKFWLSSQTPPRSVASSLSRNSRLYYQQQHQQTSPNISGQDYGQGQPFHVQTEPMFIPLSENNNYTLSNAQRGNNSPTLGPVQTPSEDLPMTPLYLGKNMGNDSYFGTMEGRGILSPDMTQIHMNTQLEEIAEMKRSEEESEENKLENDEDIKMH